MCHSHYINSSSHLTLMRYILFMSILTEIRYGGDSDVSHSHVESDADLGLLLNHDALLFCSTADTQHRLIFITTFNFIIYDLFTLVTTGRSGMITARNCIRSMSQKQFIVRFLLLNIVMQQNHVCNNSCNKYGFQLS